jgi:hypothetical protein
MSAESLSLCQEEERQHTNTMIDFRNEDCYNSWQAQNHFI